MASYKHILFINGMYVSIWGPMSRQNTLILFLKFVAKQTNQKYVDIAFGLQLSEEFPIVKDSVKAYWAWQHIQSVLNFKKCEIVLKHDDFLSSSPVSLLPTPPPPANKATTVLDLLTEIVVSQRKSSLAGTISVPLKSRRWWEVLAFQRLMPQPPIIISALVTIAVFGFLLLPIH